LNVYLLTFEKQLVANRVILDSQYGQVSAITTVAHYIST